MAGGSILDIEKKRERRGKKKKRKDKSIQDIQEARVIKRFNSIVGEAPMQ